MKNLKSKIIAILIAICCVCTAIALVQKNEGSIKTASAWGGATHNPMMENLFEALETKDSVLYQFYDNLNVSYTFDENNVKSAFGSAKDALENLARQPDYDEGHNIFGISHFYNVRTNTPSNIGEYYTYGQKNARTALEEYYAMAVSAYKNGDYSGAVRRLGFAMHYLQDIGCTLHSAKIDNFPNQHSAYENYVSNKQQDEDKEWQAGWFATNTAIANYDIKAKYGTFAQPDGSFQTAINGLALFSANGSFYSAALGKTVSFYEALETARGTKINQETYYDPVIKATIPVTQQYMAALLEQFYNDTGRAATTDSENFRNAIKHDKLYYIKNADRGNMNYITVGSNNSIVLNSFTGEASQKFRAIYHDGANPCFEFVPQ